MHAIVLTLLLAFAAPAAAGSRAGELDASFGSAGVAVANPGEFAFLYGLARQADGRYVVAGITVLPEVQGVRPYVPTLVRFDEDGSLDETFGAGGVVLPPSPYTETYGAYDGGVAVQPDGRIVVAGSVPGSQGGACGLVARHEATGALDPSFGDAGKLRFCAGRSVWFASTALQADGRVVVAGAVYTDDPAGHPSLASDHLVVRFTTDGRLDPTFGDGGVWRLDRAVHDYVQGLAIQPDGKLLLCGTDVVIRLLADGTPDPGFGTSGLRPIVTELGATEIAIDGDGRIVVAGGSSEGVGLDRYLPNGRADRSLRAARRNRTLFATGLGIDPVGRLLVTGFEQAEDFVTRYVVARLHRSGRFDRSFGKRGQAVTMPSAFDVEDGRWEGNLARIVVTDPDGDVVVGIHQSSGFTLLRYRGSRRAR